MYLGIGDAKPKSFLLIKSIKLLTLSSSTCVSASCTNTCEFSTLLSAKLMALNFPFPHEYPIGQDVFSALNIPLKSINGLHYVGITSLTLLIISLYFLGRSLEMYHNRMILIAILLAFFLPVELVGAYQKTFASGIHAVHYDRENSHCRFEMKNDTILSASCDLPFENYKNETIMSNE